MVGLLGCVATILGCTPSRSLSLTCQRHGSRAGSEVTRWASSCAHGALSSFIDLSDGKTTSSDVRTCHIWAKGW
eukprot:4858741-Prymnesium_polylepis.1